jgi:hypothetical protein
MHFVPDFLHEFYQNLHNYELLEAKEQVFGKYNLLVGHYDNLLAVTLLVFDSCNISMTFCTLHGFPLIADIVYEH